MQSFFTSLLDHPILLVVMLMFFLGFVGMTYEFILRLCGKSPFCPELKDVENKDDTEPPELANVPKTPNDPDDVLEGAAKFDDKIEGAEEVEDEDGNTTIEYVFTTDNDPPVERLLDFKGRHRVHTRH